MPPFFYEKFDMKYLVIFFYICIYSFSDYTYSALQSEKTFENEDKVEIRKRVELAKLNVYKKEYEKARVLFMQAIELGSSDAAYYLALLYVNGNGVDKNLAIAKNWYTVAANGGYVIAQYELGVLYSLSSQQNRSDFKKAWKWLSLASKNGNNDASNDLAVLYSKQKQYQKAFDILQPSVEDKHAASMYTLSQFYLFGLGVTLNSARALSLLDASANKKYIPAMLLLARLYAKGEHVEKDTSKSEAFYKKAYEKHNSKQAGVELARLYVEGNNLTKAKPILSKLVAEEYIPAKVLVKQLLEYQKMLKQNKKEES